MDSGQWTPGPLFIYFHQLPISHFKMILFKFPSFNEQNINFPLKRKILLIFIFFSLPSSILIEIIFIE